MILACANLEQYFKTSMEQKLKLKKSSIHTRVEVTELHRYSFVCDVCVHTYVRDPFVICNSHSFLQGLLNPSGSCLYLSAFSLTPNHPWTLCSLRASIQPEEGCFHQYCTDWFQKNFYTNIYIHRYLYKRTV